MQFYYARGGALSNCNFRQLVRACGSSFGKGFYTDDGSAADIPA